MKLAAISTAVAISLALASGAALAHGCPKVMKQIDDALPAAKLDPAKLEEVKKLRAEGETQHKAGKHDDSMATLGKAKSILGLK